MASNILPLKRGDVKIVSTTSLIEIDDDWYTATGNRGGPYGATERRGHMGLPLFIAWYLHVLEEEPLVTKMVTIGLMAMLGDTLAQLLQGTWVAHLNWHQMVSKLVIGITVTAPMYHYLYMFLEDWMPAAEARNRFIHLFADQVLAVPIWIVAFLVMDSVMDNPFTALDVIGGRFRGQFCSILFTSWVMYPFIQYLNFTYVPAKLRIFVLIAVSVVFNTVISYLDGGTGGANWKIEHHLVH